VGKKNLSNILFLDVETVPMTDSFHDLSNRLQALWAKKALRKSYAVLTDAEKEDMVATSYAEKAGIFPEFGKIVCISVGYIKGYGHDDAEFRLKSFFGDVEKDLLQSFADMMEQHFYHPERHAICGHNLKEFDVPYICRRMIVNRVSLPALLDIGGKKPWQTPQLLDTLEQWKFGDYKNYTSLDLLTAIMDIPSPKDDIDGSEVAHTYYQEKDLNKIVRYCEKDVVSVAQLYLRFNNIDLIDPAAVCSKTFDVTDRKEVKDDGDQKD